MTIEDLIGKGYFPKELPPPFHTTDLALKYNSIKDSLIGAIGKESSRCANFSIAKVGLIRKLIKIPNPIHQCRLSETIVNNWTDIDAIYKTSKFSFSRPIVKGERAANPKKFKEFIRRTFLESYPFVYELKTDISKYYPSIYTHSIAWAFHTKEFAKKHRSDKTLLGNKIDFEVQQTMYGQTVGIPIGPDTSLIIAEIIGCKIDEMILRAIPDIKGYRYVDDMYFFFHNYSEAEDGMLKIQQILKEFELQVNSEKTKIRRIPRGIEPDWIIQLRNFEIRNEEKKQYNDIVSYFSLAFDLALQMPNEYVLSYSISRIKHLKILSDNNFSLIENMLLKTMVAEPSTIKEVFRILYTYRSKVKIHKIEKVIFDFIKYNCPRGNDYELSWALWIIKSFKIKVPAQTASLLSKSVDSISILIVLDLLNDGLIEKSEINLSEWTTKLEEQSLIDENWLLAYECSIKNWLGKDFNYIEKVPYFKILKKNKISFYDSTRQIEPIFATSSVDTSPDYDITNSTIETNIDHPINEEIETYSNFIGDVDDIEFNNKFIIEDDIDFDYLN